MVIGKHLQFNFQETTVFIRNQDSVLFNKSSSMNLFIWLKPHLVPGHVGGSLNHVVTMPSRDWHESNGSRVVTDLDK